MVGEIVLVDVTPHLAVAPFRERIELPDTAGLVPFDLLSVRPGGRLLASDAGYPGLRALERALESVDLAPAAAARRAPRRAVRRRGIHDLDAQPVAVLDLPPDRVGLGEEHARVDREHPRRGLDLHKHVDQDRLLLLEGAGHDERGVMPLDGGAERLLCRISAIQQAAGGARGAPSAYTAHSPSPRITSKRSLRCQSMKNCMFWRLNSTGIERSRTSSSKRACPTRSAKSLNTSPSCRSASYIRTQRSTASGTRFAGRRTFRRVP